MGQSSCIQLFSTKAQTIEVNKSVKFNQISIQADDAIAYVESSQQIRITKIGQYQVNWWLAAHTARHVKQMIFSLGVNKNGKITYLHANSPTAGVEVSGTGIIEVKNEELPVTIWLENRSELIDHEIPHCGCVFLSDALVNGSISIIQFNAETNESKEPLVVAKQVLSEDVYLDFEQRVPFTKDGTEIIPEAKGVSVDDNGEITVTKGTYLAMWNVNIMPRWSWINSYVGYHTYKVSLVMYGTVKKKIASTGIKAGAYWSSQVEITSMLSGSTVFIVEVESAKISLENSSWMNEYDSFGVVDPVDAGIELEVVNSYVNGGDSDKLTDASATSLTLVKIS